MARPETIGQPLEAIEAMLHYLEEGSEKPASYGGIRQAVADQQRKGKLSRAQDDDLQRPSHRRSIVFGA